MSYLKKMDFMLTCGISSSRTTMVPMVTVLTMVTTAVVSKQIKKENKSQIPSEV